MNRFGALIAACVVSFASVAALADDAPAPGPVPGPGGPMPYYGYGHMMWGRGWGGGWDGGWSGGAYIFHPFLMILALIGLVVVAMWIVRLVAYGGMGHMHRHGAMSGRSRALDILEERFAKGEIGKEEFEEKRKLIGQ